MTEQTFGNAVSDARRRLRLRLADFLTMIDPAGTLDIATWNEIEHDRLDPAVLAPKLLQALGHQLSLDEAMLRALIAQHPAARRQERRQWNRIVDEARAFHARRYVVRNCPA